MSQFPRVFKHLGALLLLTTLPLLARDRWSELNIGPFFIDFQGDEGAARLQLDQLEQLRWVLGGLLESKDLPSLWPIRIILKRDAKTNPIGFVSLPGQFLLVCPPAEHLPLDQVAGILLDANTPRLPPDAESGLRELLGTLEAHGSHVTWGGSVPHPNLAYARMQLFGTKFEYGLSFHIFVSSLKNGSGIRVAEQNAFGKAPDVLEKEVAANLDSGNWQATTVSGRPLDAKRDFGEHAVDGAYVGAYLGDAQLESDPKSAEGLFKAAIEAGGASMPLGYEGLARLSEITKQDPRSEIEDAIRAGSTSAPVYVASAEGRPDAEALPLLKKAAVFNPKWSEPIYQQSLLAAEPVRKETLLKQAIQLEPRRTDLWVALAELQSSNGHSLAAQGTWLRAEDSAPSTEERDRIRNMHSQSEEDRLNAAEADRKRTHDAAKADDRRAQDSQLARIHAAEQKANGRLDAASDGQAPQQVVPWDATLPTKTVIGKLTRIDCRKNSALLSVTDKAGHTTILLMKDFEATGLSCAQQPPYPKVSVSYASEPDVRADTAGRILTLKVQ